ncbi:MAG: amidohydrolase family protein [Gemmatimonadaceae bacterium]
MRVAFIAVVAVFLSSSLSAQGAARPPIIDMHLHAQRADGQGPPPQFVCPGVGTMPAPAQQGAMRLNALMECENPLRSAKDDATLMNESIAIMRRYNVRAVASGEINMVRKWQQAAPGLLIASADELAPLDSIEKWVKNGTISVIGEMGFQYMGLAPDDSIPEKWIALAEKLDVPIGIHVGLGPPGAAYVGVPVYRMRQGRPLLLEDVLVRHPKARLYVMHAGWPFGDEMVALMWAHPQVYVDIGVIDWAVPKKEFDTYLKRLVDAGFGKRIMYGSDQMAWPEAIEISIQRIQTASYLTAEQKRDILYNNAARFLRLPK